MSDATFSPSQVVGSESNDGRMIGISATSSPGVLLHKGSDSNTGEVWDVVTIEATDIDSGTQSLTIAWGGLDTSDLVLKSLTSGNGRESVIVKGRLRRGLEIRAWATAADVVNVYIEVGVLEATETV